jgi:hypothetical protein
MLKATKIGVSAVVVAFAFIFAVSTVSAVSATAIYTPASGYLMVGSGMGAKAYQASNVIAAQTALNACITGESLNLDGKYGPLTKAKFMAFQASKGIAQDGIIGPITAGQLAACSGDQTTPDPVNPDLSGGETSITDVNVDDSDDTSINEGTNKAPVASIEFDVNDADAKLARVDVIFQADDSNDETDPWQVFDKVYLMDGSTTIASMSSDDEDAWDDVDSSENLGGNSADAYRIRFNNVNKVYNEDDNAEIWVAVDIASSVDGADSSAAAWLVAVQDLGLRFIDGAGVDTQEDAGSDEASFDIQEAGGDSEFSVTEATDSPDASSLEVKANTTSTQTIAIFNADADEDGNDVKISDFPVGIKMTVSDGPATGTANFSDVIDEVYVEIDGTQYTGEYKTLSCGSGDTDLSDCDAGDTATFTFDDIDNDDIVIDAGDDMDATVKVKFKSQGSTAVYANGTTIQAYAQLGTNSDFVEDADSGDDIGDVNGDATADEFALFSDGIMVDLTGGETPTIQEDQDGNNIKLTYSLQFKVTAFGDHVYIPKIVAETSNASAGLIYEIENSDGTVDTSTTATNGSLQSSADEVNNYYKVEKGTSETFTATVSVTGGTAGDFYHVQLNAVQFDVVNQTGTLTSYTLSPENDFDTNDGQIDA